MSSLSRAVAAGQSLAAARTVSKGRSLMILGLKALWVHFSGNGAVEKYLWLWLYWFVSESHRYILWAFGDQIQPVVLVWLATSSNHSKHQTAWFSKWSTFISCTVSQQVEQLTWVDSPRSFVFDACAIASHFPSAVSARSHGQVFTFWFYWSILLVISTDLTRVCRNAAAKAELCKYYNNN